MTRRLNRPAPGTLRCGLYVLTPEGPQPAGLIRPGMEIVFTLQVAAGGRPCDVAVEFHRGDRLRDHWEQRLPTGTELTRVWRLRWGEAGGSSRLICRVLIDGREMARRTALLGPEAADAQGRLAGSESAASPATLLAFAEHCQRLLESPDPCENGQSLERTH